MNTIEDSRLGKPSASSMDRYMACAGSRGLERIAEAQRVIPEGKGSSAAAEHGTLLHDANESGDVSDLDYSDAEQVAVIRQREEEITRQWCLDTQIQFEEVKIIREKRFWFDQSLASAKIDTLICRGEFALIIDAKSGRLPVPPPVRNWQLRTCAVAAVSELGFKNVRVAIANVWGKLMAPCDYDSEDLNRIAVLLRERLKEIDQPDLPTTAGDHCRYCSAAHICPSRRDQMAMSIRQRTINWDLVRPEEKLPLWIAADMAQKAGAAIKDQIKADLTAGLDVLGLSKKPDGETRKIADTREAYDMMEWICDEKDESDLMGRFLDSCSISIENFKTFYRDLTGASKEDAEKFIAEKCQAFITKSPRSGSVTVEKTK